MAYEGPSDASSGDRSARLSCPQCGESLVRIRRRWIDRVLSMLAPVQRYRCRNHACQWRGNVAAGRTDESATEPDAPQ